MAGTPEGTVKTTGANAGDILVGIAEHPGNPGLRITIHQEQHRRQGGRVRGGFDLLDAGNGTYSPNLQEYEGESFAQARELIELVRANGGEAERCTHIFNCNILRVE